MKTLITTSEVISHLPSDESLNAKFFAPHIAKTEFNFLSDDENGCLGKDFYDALIADARVFVQYDNTVPYPIAKVVIYESKLYEAVVENTGVVPFPNDPLKWKLVNKFATVAYQTLWDEYLCELLALAVAQASVFKSSFRITNKGVMRLSADNAEAASLDGVKLLKDELMSDTNILFKRMDQFLKKEKTTYTLYKANIACDTSCDDVDAPLGVYVDKSPTTTGEDYFNLENT